jgi:ribonuclease-3
MDKIISLFKNKDLYYQATKLALNGQKSGYERLEFLGDRVLGIVVAEMLYNAYPNEAEGLLAKRFVALTCGKTLAKVTKTWNLESFSEKSAHCIRHNKSILSDVCESVIGALYLDQGL